MPILNIMCPVCADVFHDAEDVYSTDCGHLFHSACLNDWQRRSNSCAQCRHYNPTSFKLYLSFDEAEENSQREIELKLKKSNDQITLLRIEIDEIENNFLQLQDQFTAVETERRNLELQIRELSDSEENFFKLQAQYTVSAEYVKELEDRVHVLQIENEYKSKDWRIKCLEKKYLKTDLRPENCGSNDSDSVVNKKLWTVEQKLKHVDEELKKEIKKNSQLALDKMKLEEHIKQINKNKPEVNTEMCQHKQDSKGIIIGSKQKETMANCSIFIKAFPMELIVLPLENIIINLAANMQLSITASDLVNVEFMHESSNTKLFAQFKSKELRNRFLSKKSVLQNNKVTRSVVIREFLSNELLELWHYAKENLQKNCFKHFFYKDGKIFAKKYRAHPKVFHIPNKSHVDMLLQQNTSQKVRFAPPRTLREQV